LIRPRTTRSASPPKVTFLVMSAYGMNGIARTVLSLAGHLAARHDVEVVTVLRRDSMPFFPFPPGVRVTTLDDQRRRDASGSRRLIRNALRKFDSRLIHPADSSARRQTLWTDLLLLRRLRRVRTGVVVCTRPSLNILGAQLVRPGLAVVGQEHMHLSRHSATQRAAIHRSYRALDAVVVLTETDRHQYEAALEGATRIDCIPNGVPEIGGPPSDVSRPTVLAAGRLTWQKGFDRLIRAFAQVARQEPAWTLNIFGRGPLRDKLNAEILKRGVADNVELHRPVRGLAWEMEQASIFVLSSRWEGFPMILIEAMSKGLPVVAFDCPTGPAEVIEHGRSGFLVPNGDRRAFVDAILELIRDEEKRRRFSAAAIERAARFSLSRTGALWEALLADLHHDTQRAGRSSSLH
jgi:glycosyltransferase involved in cell wall biosynthesis